MTAEERNVPEIHDDEMEKGSTLALLVTRDRTTRAAFVQYRCAEEVDGCGQGLQTRLGKKECVPVPRVYITCEDPDNF